MKTSIGIIAVVGLSIALTACEKVFGVKPSKSVTTETRSVSGFNSIDVSGALDVELTWSPGTEACSVKANSNLHQYIITEVNSGTLYIRRKEKVKILPGENVHIYVTVSDLNNVRLSGASTASLVNSLGSSTVSFLLSGASKLSGPLQVQNLLLSASGASDFDLTGKAGYASMGLSGASEFSGFGFACDTLDAILSGASEAKITVYNLLNVEASGASSLKYTGNAVIGDLKLSGSSEVTKQ